jgi:hypothetical protein
LPIGWRVKRSLSSLLFRRFYSIAVIEKILRIYNDGFTRPSGNLVGDALFALLSWKRKSGNIAKEIESRLQSTNQVLRCARYDKKIFHWFEDFTSLSD